MRRIYAAFLRIEDFFDDMHDLNRIYIAEVRRAQAPAMEIMNRVLHPERVVMTPEVYEFCRRVLMLPHRDVFISRSIQDRCEALLRGEE
jgi:hypothetical protein